MDTLNLTHIRNIIRWDSSLDIRPSLSTFFRGSFSYSGLTIEIQCEMEEPFGVGYSEEADYASR